MDSPEILPNSVALKKEAAEIRCEINQTPNPAYSGVNDLSFRISGRLANQPCWLGFENLPLETRLTRIPVNIAIIQPLKKRKAVASLCPSIEPQKLVSLIAGSHAPLT